MPAPSPFLNEDHAAFRRTVRRFVEREITPHIETWEAAKAFPRELYGKAGAMGLLGVGFPDELGGTPADAFYEQIATEELARAGSGGIIAGLMSHGIALPPIIALASDELKAALVPAVLSGERIAALAVTEPGGGSDVASLRTTAVRDGDHWLVNGDKTFITSGMRADVITTAVRTGGPGLEGISILAVEGDPPGLSRRPLAKMGWWCSDTAHLHFDNCRVPAGNLVGAENMGFLGLMANFSHERLMLAAMAWAFSRVCLEDAVDWAEQRKTFGRPLIARQVIRHKLVEMRTRIDAVGAWLERLTWQVEQGGEAIAEVCMLKNLATATLEFCAGEAVQILGGMGYMQGTRVERIFRETKVLSIGGGASEVLADLAARQLGW